MTPTEFTFSPELRAALEHAFAPFLLETALAESGGKNLAVPLSQWVRGRHKTPLSPVLAIRLASTLEHVLALEAGKEGLELLEAIDGIIHGGGKPAILMHGLPLGDTGMLVNEAFRRLLLPQKEERFPGALPFRDGYNPGIAGDYIRDSVSVFHQDGNDFSMIAGINAGANPRHTVILSAEEFVAHLASLADPVHPNEARLKANFMELLQLPIWPVGSGMEFDTFIDHNARYHADEAGSERYNFTQIRPSSLKHLTDSNYPIPKRLLPALGSLQDVVLRMGDDDVMLKQGPVLGAGDLLIFNDWLVIHAGGPHVHDSVPRDAEQVQGGREICAYDIDRDPDVPYGVRPGDRVAQPIRIGGVGSVGIDPAAVAR